MLVTRMQAPQLAGVPKHGDHCSGEPIGRQPGRTRHPQFTLP